MSVLKPHPPRRSFPSQVYCEGGRTSAFFKEWLPAELWAFNQTDLFFVDTDVTGTRYGPTQRGGREIRRRLARSANSDSADLKRGWPCRYAYSMHVPYTDGALTLSQQRDGYHGSIQDQIQSAADTLSALLLTKRPYDARQWNGKALIWLASSSMGLVGYDSIINPWVRELMWLPDRRACPL